MAEGTEYCVRCFRKGGTGAYSRRIGIGAMCGDRATDMFGFEAEGLSGVEMVVEDDPRRV